MEKTLINGMMLLAVLWAGCAAGTVRGGKGDEDGSADGQAGDSDADTDGDTDGDTDSDTDGDTDGDGDTDTDTDTDADGDTDTDTDGDTDTDTDTDGDADADGDVDGDIDADADADAGACAFSIPWIATYEIQSGDTWIPPGSDIRPDGMWGTIDSGSGNSHTAGPGSTSSWSGNDNVIRVVNNTGSDVDRDVYVYFRTSGGLQASLAIYDCSGGASFAWSNSNTPLTGDLSPCTNLQPTGDVCMYTETMGTTFLSGGNYFIVVDTQLGASLGNYRLYLMPHY